MLRRYYKVLIRKNLLLSTLIIFLITLTFSVKVNAIEKPTYADYIRSQHEEELTDAQVERIIAFENLTKKIREIPNDIKKDAKEKENQKDHTTNTQKAIVKKNELNLGTCPTKYLGASNFKLPNYMLACYSLLDISKSANRQPLINTSKNSLSNYKFYGFEKFLTKDINLSALDTIRWILYQFEEYKFVKKYDNEKLEMKIQDLYDGKIARHVELESSNLEVKYLGNSTKELYNSKRGDILLYVEDDMIKDYGIFLGRYEDVDEYYCLAFKKHINNVNDNEELVGKYRYMTNVMALSFINSTSIYPQEINGSINLISPTQYNYILKMDYLD